MVLTSPPRWEHDEYWKAMKANVARQRQESIWQETSPNSEHRKSIAQQAQALLKGKAKWAPTWQAVGDKALSASIPATAPR